MRKLSLLLFTIAFNALAQAQEQVEMATAMRSSGKIYVVVAVLVLVFLGIIGYLIFIDRKVQKLEDKIK